MPPAGTCALTAAIMLQHSGRQNSSSWPALPGCTVWMCIHPSAHLPRRVATGRRATGRIRHAPEQCITPCCRPTSTAQRIVCSAVEHYIHCISHQPHLAHGVAPNWRIRTRSVGGSAPGSAAHAAHYAPPPATPRRRCVACLPARTYTVRTQFAFHAPSLWQGGQPEHCRVLRH